MKVVLLALALVLAVGATTAQFSSVEDLTAYDFHRRYGIAEASRIRKAEEEAAKSGSASRIVNGQVSDISQTPYQAGLVITIMWVFNSVCGGSLISSNRVVTAAHCQHDGTVTAQSMTVVLGSNTIFSGGNRQSTTNIVMHPQWNPRTAANDIAVIRLSRAVSFTNVIQTIALPSANDGLFVGATTLISGFGLTRDGGQIPQNQRLSSVSVPVITNAQCANVFGQNVHASTICTSGAGGRGPCQGDSGGPVVTTVSGRRILIGAVSFGARAGCSVGHPSGHARITSFVNWIRTI